MSADKTEETGETLDELVTVLKAVADPTRLRLLGMIADRARCGQDLASALGISAPTVSHHLQVLREAGLLQESREGPYRFYSIDLGALRGAAKSLSTKKSVQSFADASALPDNERKVLQTFFDGPRLVAFPARRKKRLICFEEVLRRIPRRKEYGERELSKYIEAINPDYCTIRREFIMNGYMERDSGRYRLTDKGKAVIAAR
jgi:DNA-binding transcriptional ArsR family regulator